MNFLSELIEHDNIKILGIVTIVLSYILDALGKSNYFYIATSIIIIILIYTVYDIKKMKKSFENNTIAIPIVINVASNESINYALIHLFKEVEKNSNIDNLQKNLKKYYNITNSDLTFHYNNDLYNQECLISFAQIIRYQISKIKESLPNNVHFHLAYYNKPSVGFVVGQLFLEEELTLYQQNQTKEGFKKIATINTRKYKTEVNDYSKFTIIEKISDINHDTVLLSIRASGHKISFNSASLSKYKNIIKMDANHSGEIFLDEDWIIYAQEIFTQLNKLQTQFKHIVIAHSMPESIAVIVGKAINNYWNIQITQYEKGEYRPLIRLDKFSYYF
ncbi:MAG: SAVED domain-containing protein [Sulfurimonas sp.]|nr:SAVED domain-containing protein [Sulfurimonas sp.]MDQ7061465.1 SAVED domain-containing protein [Sulfurimonas sp.]